ncbi:MAG: hypothetical protein ACOYYS_14815 [Chloroflexota bacterium]
MTMKPSAILIALIGILACCLITALAFERQTRWAHRLYDDIVLDNKNHYLPCEALPAADVVLETVAAHQETVTRIEQVNPGNVGIEVDTTTCPGKADLLIWYASHSDRQAIEHILSEDTFFGIPYRLQNR